MVETDFTFSLPIQQPSSTSPPTTPTFGASSLSRFSPPATPFSRRAAQHQKLLAGVERKASLYRRPKWYMFFFGGVKLPVGMETKRIKAGRISTNQSGLSMESGGGGGGRKMPWRLLHSLSCGAGIDVVGRYPARLAI